MATRISDVDVRAGRDVPSAMRGTSEGNVTVWPWGSHDRWIMLLACLIASATCLLGEKIDINNGFGWDGAAYGAFTKDVYLQIVQQGYPSSAVQRVAPFAIAHVLLRLFVWPIGDADVIRFFIVANVVGITLASWLVIRTLDALGAGARTKWVAILALLLNYCVAKWFAYYPVIADMPGFLLGAAMVYAFVRRNLMLLYVLTFLAAFTWPAAYYEGLVLTIWSPFRSPATSDNRGYSGIALALSAGIAVAFAVWSIYLVMPENYVNVRFNVHEPMRQVIWLAIGLGAGYFFFGVWYLARPSLAAVVRSLPRLPLHLNTWLAVLVLVVMVQWIVRRLATEVTGIELDVYPHMVVSGIFRPGIFFLSHVVFFGPIVVLAAFAWPRIGRLAADLGPAVPLALGVMLLLAIGSESRREVNFLPLLVVVTVLASDLEQWTWRRVVGFGAVCAVTSKLWLPIGPLGDPNNLKPILFMNLGPWMELDAYLLQLGALVVVVAILWMLSRSTPSPALATVEP